MASCRKRDSAEPVPAAGGTPEAAVQTLFEAIMEEDAEKLAGVFFRFTEPDGAALTKQLADAKRYLAEAFGGDAAIVPVSVARVRCSAEETDAYFRESGETPEACGVSAMIRLTTDVYVNGARVGSLDWDLVYVNGVWKLLS